MNIINKTLDHSKNKYHLTNIDLNPQLSKYTFDTSGVTIYSPYKLYETQQQFTTYIIQCLKQSKNGLIQSPTGTGKTLSLLCSTLSYIKYEQQQIKKSTRIIYTSRTHTQLKQIIHQLIKTGFILNLAILASRDHLCINHDLNQLNGKSKQLQCKLRIIKQNQLFCKYYHHQEYYQKINSIGKICDLQDINVMGKQQEFCPYFYQKYCKNKANLILMPYTYLLDQKLSTDQIAPLVQNSIIIFDQAHNIINACESSKQFFINLNTLSRALQHLSTLRQHKLQQQKGTGKYKSADENNVEKGMASSINELQMHACFVSLTHTLVQTLHIPPQQSGLIMNIHDFLQCLDNGTQKGQFGKLRTRIKQLCQSSSNIQSDIKFQPYWSLQSWLIFIFRVQEMYILDSPQTQISYYKCQIAYNGSDIKISLLCLDPKITFSQLIKMKPRSIILTSGTLNPLNSIPIQLQIQFYKPLSCPHIINKQQINGCILTHGPNLIQFNFCFDNRNNTKLFQQLGFTIFDIVNKTPNGVIVFVSSYLMLDKIKQQFSSCGVMTQLYSKKSIFFEKQNSSDFKQILQKYLIQSCKGKGALLFALVRGKISQGLDFADEKCRAVILVGVPYLASKDIKVISKMQYLDWKNNIIKSMNGNQWYICQTIRGINQSIGRIIRNKNDYGSIYLIDSRFKKKQIFTQISNWIINSLKIIDDYQEFKFKLNAFTQYFIQKSKNDSKTQCYFTSQIGTKLTNKINPNQKIKVIKNSISINSTQTQNKSIQPIQQLQHLKSSLLPIKPQQQQQQQLTRQRIIFKNKQNKKLSYIEARQCPVCRMERKLIKNTQCIHQICQQCWDVWLKKDLRCPLCRVRVRQKYLIKL